MRYVTKAPRSDGFWDDRMVAPLSHPQVFVADPVDTGLLDGAGRKLYRVADEVGFVPRREREQR